ncbi:hypothetical protein MALV_57470 (plasmid) [Mycolicibacterium alvei]|uniref:Uncharacterized protein n=1 Tax=Mycolicibacterium alvei TaxID=67081 RepID=A0A6N4V4G4_9MYCO|nr:hypothetical protein MALV_57470 [Mycolicibacterium alvei]
MGIGAAGAAAAGAAVASTVAATPASRVAAVVVRIMVFPSEFLFWKCYDFNPLNRSNATERCSGFE